MKLQANIYNRHNRLPMMTSQQAISILGNCEKTQLTEIAKTKTDQELIKVSSLFTDTEIQNLSENKVCFFVESNQKFYDIGLGVNWQQTQIPKQSTVLRNSQDNSILTINAVSGGSK